MSADIDNLHSPLPSCPRPGHEHRKVIKDGTYGTPPRQRYRCIGDVVSRQSGKVSGFHRFTPLVPHLVGEPNDNYGQYEARPEGPSISRGYTFPIREIAGAFVAVGAGDSYAHAADRARVSAGREPLGGGKGGALVAEWLDALAPVVLDAYDEVAWPETLILAGVTFASKPRRVGDQRLAFHVLGAYGRDYDGQRGRVWALQAAKRRGVAEWEEFLRSLAVTGTPRIVLADGEESIVKAVKAVWPYSAGQDFAQPVCTKHHSARSGRAPRPKSITALAPAGDHRLGLPENRSTATLRTALNHVLNIIEPRSFSLRNKDRINVTLGLVRLHLNGIDIERRYSAIIRKYIEEGGTLPLQRRTAHVVSVDRRVLDSASA